MARGDGAQLRVKPPDEKTVRDFEKFLRQRHPEANVPRFVLFHEHIVRLCKKAGVLQDKRIWVNDSTPMWCYGAVLDTVRLLGEGVGKLARQWAEATRTSFEKVCRAWNAPWVLAPSIKGWFDIDWQDKQAQDGVITQLAARAVELVDEVRREIDQSRPRAIPLTARSGFASRRKRPAGSRLSRLAELDEPAKLFAEAA